LPNKGIQIDISAEFEAAMEADQRAQAEARRQEQYAAYLNGLAKVAADKAAIAATDLKRKREEAIPDAVTAEEQRTLSEIAAVQRSDAALGKKLANVLYEQSCPCFLPESKQGGPARLCGVKVNLQRTDLTCPLVPERLFYACIRHFNLLRKGDQKFFDKQSSKINDLIAAYYKSLPPVPAPAAKRPRLDDPADADAGDAPTGPVAPTPAAPAPEPRSPNTDDVDEILNNLSLTVTSPNIRAPSAPQQSVPRSLVDKYSRPQLTSSAPPASRYHQLVALNGSKYSGPTVESVHESDSEFESDVEMKDAD